MELRIKGKQIDVGDALSEHVRERLIQGVSKYFEDPIEGEVTFSREGRLYRADCLVHVGHGIRLRSHATADEPYVVFDKAAERIEKQLRRYKSRLMSHQKNHKNEQPVLETAQGYVLAPEQEGTEVPDSFEPVIVAEESTNIPTLTVGEAVMRMDLADLPAKLFRNRAHNGLNMVYRRADGNIGWVDPRGSRGPDEKPGSN